MKDFRIHIIELGPIKDAEIRLAPFMIFTGKSSLGKSYVNFLSYYVFDLFGNNGLSRFLKTKIEGKQWNNQQLSFGFSIGEMKMWMAEDATSFLRDLLAFPKLECNVEFLFDISGDESISIVVTDKGSLNKDDIENGLREIRVEIVGYNVLSLLSFNDLQYTISSAVTSILSKEILGELVFSAFLLPPGRTSLINNSFSVKKMASNTGMYDRFLHDYDSLQNSGLRFLQQKEDNQFFVSQIKRLIHGDVITEKDETYLLLDNGKPIPVSAAASSIRELSPLLFWIKNRNVDRSSICLEEPEAHAHPEMQFGIAELLATCLNKGAFMQITTHSDYLLTRINQLIRLYKFQKNHPKEFENSSFVRNKRQTINPQDVKAYYFEFSKEVGHVIVHEQKLEDGIPFDSFRNVIVQQMEFNDELTKYLDNDN